MSATSKQHHQRPFQKNNIYCFISEKNIEGFFPNCAKIQISFIASFYVLYLRGIAVLSSLFVEAFLALVPLINFSNCCVTFFFDWCHPDVPKFPPHKINVMKTYLIKVQSKKKSIFDWVAEGETIYDVDMFYQDFMFFSSGQENDSSNLKMLRYDTVTEEKRIKCTYFCL